LDLRSAVLKEALALLETLAVDYREHFEQLVYKYISPECLIKALCNGKKVIVDMAHDCAFKIL
jgi:hypothetical protein